jgi:hypothetical protein
MGRDAGFVWATVTATAIAAAALAGCGHAAARMPRFGSNLMPPVVPYAADTVTVSGRRFHHLADDGFDLYAETADVLPVVDARMRSAARQFARHFGGAPRVAVLLFNGPADPYREFNGPADPYREFDFTPWVTSGTQVLAFVRDRGAERRRGNLGLDEALLDSRLAELLLAAYADSVIAERTGARDAAGTRRAVERLPHWFAEAVITRVSRPEAVEQGLRYVKANRVRLMPLQRLFGMARLGVGTPTWGELARRYSAGVSAGPTLAPGPARPGAGPPPALVAAYSTAFGQYLVDRYGPTFLQAVADELLLGLPTEQALVSLPGVPGDPRALEEEWRAWLAAQR